MGNAIEFYDFAADELGVPAGRPVIFLDGKLCGFLEVKRIERGISSKGSSAVLEYDVSAMNEADVCAVEDIESIVAMGSAISIRQIYNGGIGEVQVESISVFEGNIEGMATKIDGDGQSVIITACDFVATMDRMTVFGRRYVDAVNGSVFDADMQTIFNEDGVGNASTQAVMCNGKSYTIFKAGSGKLWTYGEIIHYLLSEYVLLGLVGVPTLEELDAVTGNTAAGEVSLEGKSLVEAVELCCERTGVEFKVEATYRQVSPESAIVFYKPGQCRTVELNCQYAGEQLDITKTNIVSVSSQRQRLVSGYSADETLSERVSETIDVETVLCHMHYGVGDRVVCSPDSRDILGIRRNRKDEFIITDVTIDIDKQQTSLEIVRRRVY